MQEVTTATREKQINDMEWIDWEEWKRKMEFQDDSVINRKSGCRQILGFMEDNLYFFLILMS